MPRGYDVWLTDGRYEVGLKYADGSVGFGLKDLSSRPSTLRITGGGTKFGDWDPNFSHIEQRDWSGGRGQDDFFDDPSRFYDGDAWTVTQGKIIPALKWQVSSGYRDVDENPPDDMNWRGVYSTALDGSPRFYSTQFTAGQNYSADKIYVWLKRVGSPGTMTLELCDDSSGTPGTVLKTATVTTSDVTDIISLFQVFDFTGTESLTSSTVYHIAVFGAKTDDTQSHWEVGVDTSSSVGLKPPINLAIIGGGTTSADVTQWISSGDELYYRVVVADDPTRWHYFFLGDDMYKVSQPDTGNSALYAWNETTDVWDAVTIGSGDALAGVVTSVAIIDRIAYMSRGTGNTIWRFRNNAGTYQGDNDGAAKADLLYSVGRTLWRYIDVNVFISNAPSSGITGDLRFGPSIQCGDKTYSITAMLSHNGTFYVRKQDALGFINSDEKYEELSIGLDAVFETGSSNAMASHNKSLYFSWSHSVERLFEGTLDDIGPWKGTGLPSDRAGVISAILPIMSWQFWAIDAGTGTSSVLAYNGIGLSEIFRAPEAGQRIRSLAWQPVADAQPRLWISCGTDSYYINFPQDTLNPIRDTTVNYQHESYIEFSLIDMGAAELVKLYHDLTILSKNLSDEIKISLDIQYDEFIGLTGWTNWIHKGIFLDSPTDAVVINEGNRKALRGRLRIETNDADIPPIISATLLKGIARVPERRQLTLRVDVRQFQVTRDGAPDKAPSAIFESLSAMSKGMRVVRMETDIHEYKDINVFVDTITPQREVISPIDGESSGIITFTARVLE